MSAEGPEISQMCVGSPIVGCRLLSERIRRMEWMVSLSTRLPSRGLVMSRDLSLAVMPGAFVFDPGDSVESIQMSRTREAVRGAMAPAPTPQPKAVAATPIAARRPVLPAPRTPRAPLRTRYGLPTPLDQPAPPSEDSH